MASEEEVIALAERVEQLSYFQILGLPHRYATLAEVKASFHAFALHFHPDQFTGVEDDEVKQAAKEVFKRAVEAYEVLRDARLQRRYVEAYLKRGGLRMAPVEFARRATVGAIPTAGMPPGPASTGPASAPSSAVAVPASRGSAPVLPAPAAAPEARRKPLSEMTWVDEMRTDDGREVAQRIDKMMREGRFQPAMLQMSLLESLEPGNPAVAVRKNMLRRRLEQGR